MRNLVAIATTAAATGAALLMPAAAHAVTPGVLTICTQGAHADVLVSPATTSSAGPGSGSFAKDTCSDFDLDEGTYVVSLAQHGRTPLYGPSTANDGGNFGFGEQPFDHIVVKYNALPDGGMTAVYDDSSVEVNLGNSRTSGVEVDFVFQNQLH